MKQTNFLKSFFLLCALIVGSSSVWGSTVTYTVTSRTAVSTTGTAPTNSSASFVNTYTGNNKDQMTSGNSQTLTLSNYNGYHITGLTLSMKSNGSGGAGKLSYSTDGGASWTYLVGSSNTGVAFSNSAWHGSYTTTYTNVTKSTLDIICGTSNILIKIEATANSLYCQSYTITYEANKTLSSIAVTTNPKTAYKIGETLDLTGIVVTGTYDDSTTEDVTSKCSFDPVDGAVLGTAGNQNVAISYNDKNCNLPITVASVTGLAVKTAPTTVKYRIGDNLDLTGLVLTATYSDEGTKDITDFTASPADGSALNTSGNVDVTLSYYGQNCTQRVTVGTLSSLTYNSGTFANTTYTEKDFFDPTGLVVTAHYSNSDGLEEVIDDYILTPSTETALSTTNDKVVVSYTWAETEQTVDIPITVNAGAKYTVSFDAGSGAYTGGNITETEYQGGITLPAATIDLDGWVFAGWATASQTSTQNRPTLYLEGDTYYPTANTTLYAVYTLEGIDGTKYQKVTELSEATSASTIIIVSNKYNKVLDNALGSVDAPDEEDGKITPSDNIVWSISGNNTDGFELTTTALSTNNTLGRSLIPTTSGNIELTTDNNKWIVEEHTGGTNLFVLKNKTNPSDNTKVGVLEYNATPSKWQYYCMAASTYKTSNDYSKSQLYIPVKTVYNSNPAAAIIQPTVAFEKGNTTLYLDGTKNYTNAASVTGVAKSVTGYKSSDESVATVNASGEVTAVGIGTATITAYLDIELGVHKAAEASYVVTVKNTTTLAGIKAQATNSTAVDFTADLANDLVITYVNGSHAYLQSGDVAVYASCATGDWEAGKKFTGAITGQIKRLNNEYQITSIGQTPVAGGIVPDAVEVAITDLTTANYATYEGRKIAINGATVNTAMTTSQNSGGKITTDGTNTLNIYAREKGITLTKDEKGNFVGYIGRYNDGIRYYMYEQSQFTKTYNAPTAQTLTFDEDDVNLDEDTEALANYVGQAVNGAHTTLTWSIEDGSDDILTSLNASTGALVLNGSIGAAIINVSAVAADVEEAGVITPYLAANTSYTITVNPRYTVTFSANGQETEVRQESYGAAVTIPTIAPVGNYEVQGWLDEEIDTHTDTKPVGLIEESTYTPANDITLYAVYAKQTIGDDEDVELYNNTGSTGTDATSGITASGNINQSNGNSKPSFGLTSSSNKTITLSGIDISTVKVATMNFDYKVGKNGTKYSSLTVTQYDNQDNVLGTPANVTASNTSYNTSDDISLNTSCVKITIVCNPAAGSTYDTYVDNIVINVVRPSIIYYDYRTSLTNATVTMTIGPAGFNTWHQPFAAEFIADGDNGKAYYAADVDANQVVNFQQFSENKIPANTGAIIKGEVNAEVSYIILDDDVDFSAENLLHGTNTTETITADVDYYYFISGRTKVSEDPLTYEYGFFVPKSLETGSTFTNNANKAYLQVLKTKFGGATSKGLGMSWTDAETNGITNVNSTYTDGHYYNLAGQRVSEDYKGVVIYNGKKIIKK